MTMSADTPFGSEAHQPAESNRTPSPADTDKAERRLALALWKAERQQPVAAQRLFEEALSLDPANVTFRMAYAAFQAHQEDWTIARDELEQAITDDAVTSAAWLNDKLANAPNDVSLMHLQALLLTRLGRYEEAQAIFERLLIVAPGHGQILADHAALQDAMGNMDAADRSYQAALEVNPADVTWLVAYGTFLERHERLEEALRTLERAQELNPQDTNLQEKIALLKPYANRGVEARKRAALAKLLLEEQDNEDEAAALVSEALQMAPNCALAHRVQAELLRRKGFLAEAETHLVQALEIEPDNAEYQTARRAFEAEIEPRRQQVIALVSQARATTDREAARTLLDQALDLIADDTDAHLAYAELLRSDLPDEAEKHLQAVLAVAPQSFTANKLHAILLRNQGREPEAEQYLRTALAMQPEDEELVDEYTGLLIDQGRYRETADRLLAVQSAFPHSARLQGRLAVAWTHLGRRREALTQFEMALQMDPQNAMLHREYAIALRDEGQHAMAEDHFRKALELNRLDAVAYRAYAALLTAQQRCPEAWDHIQQAMAIHPDDVDIQAEARSIEERYRQLERVEGELAYAVWLSQQATPKAIATARQAFKRALELDPSSKVVCDEYKKFRERYGEEIIPPPVPGPIVEPQKPLWRRVIEALQRIFGG